MTFKGCRVCVGLIVLLYIISVKAAADPPNPARTPPSADATATDDARLAVRFVEGFETDPRKNVEYTLHEPLAWEAGHATLGPAAAISRTLDSGRRVQLQLDVRLPELSKASDGSVTQIEFEIENEMIILSVERRREQGRAAARLSVIRQLPAAAPQQGGKSVTRRQIELAEDVPAGVWTVIYRHGLVGLAVADQELLAGYAAPPVGDRINRWRVLQRSGTISLQRIELQAVALPSLFTTEQRAELIAASDANARVLALFGAGLYAEAEPIAKKVLTIRERVLGPNHPFTAASLNNLGKLYESLGKHAEAAPFCLRALAIYEKVYGPDHPGTALGLNDLAVLYYVQRKYAEAEPLLRRALAIYERVQGPEHADTAGSLSNLAMLYQTQRKFAEAEPLSRRALAIREKLLGPEHIATALSLLNLAALCEMQTKYAEAEPLYRRSLTIYEGVLGPEHPDTARCLNNIAALLESQGKYVDAEPVYKRALEIREKMLGAEHSDTATTVNNLAALYETQGKFNAAEPLYRRALAFREQVLGPEHPDTALSLNNLAHLQNARGKFAEAEALYRRVLEIREKKLGPEHPDTAVSLNNLGNLFGALGRDAQAEELLRRALDICEKKLGPEHPDTIVCLNNLAALFESQGNNARAEPLLRRALAITLKVNGSNHPAVAYPLNDLAALFVSHGKYAHAEPLFRRALAIREKSLGPEHPDTATSLHNLADLHRAQGRRDEAEPLYRRERAINEKVLGAQHPAMAINLNSLAELFESQRKYAEAEPLYRQALAICAKSLGPEHPATARILNNLGAAVQRQRKNDEAELLYNRALAIRRKVLRPGHPDMIVSLCSLAPLLAKGNLTKAIQLYTEAAQAIEMGRGEKSLTGLDRAANTSELAVFPILATLLAEDGQANLAATRWEQSLGRGLWDDIAVRLADSAKPRDRQRERDLLTRIDQLDTIILAIYARPPENRDEADLRRLQQERLDQQAALSAYRRALVAGLGFESGTVYSFDKIQATLADDEALIGWLDRGDEIQSKLPRHWGIVIRHTGPAAWIPLPGTGDAGTWTDEDHELSEQLASALSNRGRNEQIQALTEAVRMQRVALLLPQLAARDGQPPVRRLIVLPSTALRGVPADVLFGDEYVVSYAPSGTIYAYLREQRAVRKFAARQGSLLAIGDPAFDPPEDTAASPQALLADASRAWRADLAHVPSLPGSRREVAALAAIFRKAKLGSQEFLGSHASEQQLADLSRRDKLKDFTFIHLATHGLADAARPLESKLILAQDQLPDPYAQAKAGQPVFRGELTAAAILGTWELSAELVTLSTCQSALGRHAAGEGYLGFAQALLLAGSRSLVLSLWNVDDTATSLLMTRFYENLLGQRSGLNAPLYKAEALKEAKQWLRALTPETIDQILAAEKRGEPLRSVDAPGPQSADAEHPFDHPSYWSAFLLIGDPG